jgi:putative Mg2+ transporter-C (MgtC) family protein
MWATARVAAEERILPTGLDFEIMARLALAAVLGAVIGAEREYRDRDAGLRTYMLVAIGSALFTVVSIFGFVAAGATVATDTSRVAAQIVSGIGFLGAGIVFRSNGRTQGVTTAAGIWAMAAIGIAAGAGLYWTAAFATVLVLVILLVLRRLENLLQR